MRLRSGAEPLIAGPLRWFCAGRLAPEDPRCEPAVGILGLVAADATAGTTAAADDAVRRA
ncbi:hypothetical protein ACQPYE_30840 [Actinosynnema sp. CA-299493]